MDLNPQQHADSWTTRMEKLTLRRWLASYGWDACQHAYYLECRKR